VCGAIETARDALFGQESRILREEGNRSSGRLRIARVTPNRRRRLEGRRAFIARLASVVGRRRHAVLTVAALAVGAVVALLVGTANGAPSVDRAGIVGVSAVALGFAAGGFAVYVGARVFLVLDLRARPELPWRADGVLERYSDEAIDDDAGIDDAAATDDAGAAVVDAADVAPLRIAMELARVRGLWGVLIGWAQCGVGTGLFVAAALTFPATPWIIALVGFVVGGLGQDAAFRAYRLLGRMVAAERVLARTVTTSTNGAPATGTAATGTAATGSGTVGTGAARPPAPVMPQRRGTARRMPPRAPGRGSALELPDE
jgi:hypothetical protein